MSDTATKERRRYALLQAAATIYAMSFEDGKGGVQAVEAAITLLSEIEKRESWEEPS